MSVPVRLDELLAALDWVSAGEVAALDCDAYLSRTNGTVHWCGEGIDEEPPEGLEDGSLYIALPRKSEFDLGRSLAFRFVEERLPHERETVRDYFRRRGAYARFKSLLAHLGQLDEWHQYEQVATETALREWCAENGFLLVTHSRPVGA